jgi:tetratricopeptide (TPR) repeat protein
MAEDDLSSRAIEALERGDTAGAITDLKAHLDREPEDETAWLTLGTAYSTVEHWPDAVRALARAVEIDGSIVDARLAYARALTRIGKLDDAAFQLLQASRVDPNDARVLKDLGIVFYDRRLYDKAASWLARAADAAPQDGRVCYALGLAHEARKDVGAAMAAYREALRREPALADARKTLVDLLASMGEHEQAIAELEALLALERSDEQAAHNREVLLRALAEMKARRLLGKTERELEQSALVQEGQLRRKGTAPGGEGEEVVRYIGPLTELLVTCRADATRHIVALLMRLTDPEKAARTPDDTFKVTVVAQDGRHVAADFATAASLTFLREAVGCPMTHASELYQRLLAGEPSVEWRGAAARFATITRSDKPTQRSHGILVTEAGAAPVVPGS